MPQISEKGKMMPASPIRKLVPFAEAAKQKGIKVYHLNIGQPDINTPSVALEAVRNFDQKVVEYSEAPLVSSDIIGNTHSSIFDALSTHSEEDGYARIVSWYDNEWGYSNRVVDLIEMLVAFE